MSWWQRIVNKYTSQLKIFPVHIIRKIVSNPIKLCFLSIMAADKMTITNREQGTIRVDEDFGVHEEFIVLMKLILLMLNVLTKVIRDCLIG